MTKGEPGSFWTPRSLHCAFCTANADGIVGQRIILLHGFQKKTRKLPSKELEIARQRFRRFVEREGGEKRQ